MEDSKVRNLVSIFDLYGRFALHQEAFKCNDGPICFSEQAQHILFWTSFNVLPALQRFLRKSEQPKESGPLFTDPNLSLIQIERSFADTTMLSPQSPKFMVGSNRRANRNKTPERLDEGVGIFDDTPGKFVVGSVNQKVIQGMTAALFDSTCSLLSEWLAVGGSISETTNTISRAASEWCDIFAGLQLDQNNEVSTAIVDGMLVSFFRLIGQLVLASGNCENLTQVLTKLCHLSGCLDKTSDHLRKAFSNILAARGQPSLANELVRCFLDTSYAMLEGNTASLKCELVESFDEIFGTYRSCFLRSFFNAMTSHQQACFLLTNTLIERCPEHLKDSVHHSSAIFDLKCLWLVSKDPKVNTKVTESVIEMLLRFDTNVVAEDLQLMIEDFISQASVETGN
jgi:hypothetical protein